MTTIETTIRLLLAEITNTEITEVEEDGEWDTVHIFTFTRNDIPFTVTYSGTYLIFTTPKLTTEFTLNDCKDDDAIANTIIAHLTKHFRA